MKIRKCFISNSSSSSFLVAFSKMPRNSEELQEILFGEREEYPHPYDNEYWKTSKIASIVWEDMKNQEPNVEEELIEVIKRGWFEGQPNINLFERPPAPGETYKKINWREYDRANTEAAKTKLHEFKKKVGTSAKIFVFSYSDNDGPQGCAMEHGVLFDRLPHLKISCH